jgi:hypothetical protein
MKEYILARLKEASTWRGFVYMLTALGVTLSPAAAEAIIAAGMAIAGAIGAFLPG